MIMQVAGAEERTDWGWRPSPAWRLLASGGSVSADGGADARWAADGLDPSAAAALVEAWERGAVDRTECSAETAVVVDALAALGALLPPIPERPRVAVLERGRPYELPLPDCEIASVDDADLVVIVRTTETLRATAARAAKLNRPHLLCDLAFHHTIVLGPYVVPGQTACLSCLAERVAHRWGDDAPPVAPEASAFGSVAGALVARQLPSVAAGATLVGATVALDLDTLETTRARVLRSPWCEVCGPEHRDGRVRLPWEGEQR